jgi:hypothetical protein
MSSSMDPRTPQSAAIAWVEAVLDRSDLAAAWPRTDALLRLVLAQDWVWNRRHDPAIGHDRDWDAIATGLAADPPDSDLWDRFARDLVTMWQRTWKGFDTRSWVVRDQPEVLDFDLEMVTFFEPDSSFEQPSGERVVQPGHPAFTRRFAMRHTEHGWVVAGVNGEQLFEPGWPPKLSRPSGS